MSDWGDEIVWTAETFKQIDESTAKVPSSAPQSSEERYETSSALILDQEVGTEPILGQETPTRTLLERFRYHGSLSVTDFSSPSHCETKYLYSLLGRRDLSLAERPTHVTRSDGAKIEVNRTLAQAADKVLRKGKEIHAKLEKEIQLETVPVQTSSRAEVLCLRLMNIVATLNQLFEDGLAREIPVFGFYNGVFVRGVIDEIEKRSLGPLPEELAQDKSKLNFYFSPRKATKKPTHGYYIVDHKTRFAPRMPPLSYSRPYRIQLMLYKTLFDRLATSDFAWEDYLSFHAISAETVLSDHFVMQILTIFLSLHNFVELPAIWTVQAICQVVGAAFARIGPLQDQLQLVYRCRSPQKKKQARAKSASENVNKREASVSDLTGSKDVPIVLEEDLAVDIVAEGIPEANEGDLGEISVVQVPVLTSPKSSQVPFSPVKEDEEVGTIIGTETFTYKGDEMEPWCDDILRFWRSEREPRGPEIEEVHSKCRNCEYETGCEYLERKSRELADTNRRKRHKT